MAGGTWAVLRWEKHLLFRKIQVGSATQKMRCFLSLLIAFFAITLPAAAAPNPQLTAAAISAHKLIIGMTTAECIQSIGEPSHVNRSTTADGEREQWVYEARELFLHFRDGCLASIDEHGRSAISDGKQRFGEVALPDGVNVYTTTGAAKLVYGTPVEILASVDGKMKIRALAGDFVVDSAAIKEGK